MRWEDCGAAENKGKCVTVIGRPPGGDRDRPDPAPDARPARRDGRAADASVDVIHSFYVPAFLYQRDITPRKDQVIQFLADREGTYRGQCPQFCGLRHGEMEFEVVVESRDATSTPGSRRQTHAAADAVAGPVDELRAGREPGAGRVGDPQHQRPGTAYDPASLEAPANTPVQIEFANNDAGIPHNVAIHQGTPDRRPRSGRARSSTGSRPETYDVPAAPGRDLRLRLLGPPEHDRHPHGEVGEPRWRPPRSGPPRPTAPGSTTG